MTRHDDDDRAAWYLLAIVLVCVALAAAPQCTARATEYGAREQLALARIAASEIGWAPTAELAAIHEVLLDRSRRLGLNYYRTACAYSSRSCDRLRRDPRRWIAHLDTSGRRPAGWPRGTSWRLHAPRWEALHDHAGAVLRGEVESPCEGHVSHWGAPYGEDLARALRYGWERVECPGARNAFWRTGSAGAS